MNTISKQLAQQIVDSIHDVCGYNINFINTQGIIYASSNPQRLNTYHEIGRQVAHTGETIEVETDNDYPGTSRGINIPIYYHKIVIAVVGISGDPAEVRKYAHLAERISIILLHEQELNARHRTIDEKKQYLLRALVNNDFNNQAYLGECIEEFKIDTSNFYRMIKIDLNSRYNLKNKSMLEQDIAILFSSIRDSLYTYIYPNHFIGLVSEDAFSLYEYMLSKFSESHTDIIKIAVGKSMPFYKSNESWLSAETAMDSIKETQKSYVIFDELTLEILLAGIPHNKLSEYSSKVLANISTTDINLLKIYYDEDMSLQHTAERLYLHKNTVQQHLNRISTQTGYNPRSFKDAVLLYLALHITQ